MARLSLQRRRGGGRRSRRRPLTLLDLTQALLGATDRLALRLDFTLELLAPALDIRQLAGYNMTLTNTNPAMASRIATISSDAVAYACSIEIPSRESV